MTRSSISMMSTVDAVDFVTSARKFTSSRIHTMARLLLVVTVCAAPWAFGAVEAWAWGTLTGLVFLALVLWALGNFERRTLRIVWTPLYWPFLAFLLIAMVQWSSGLTFDRIATREAALKIMTDFVIFFLAGQLLNTQPENGRALEWFGLATVTVTGAISGLAMAQHFTGTHAIYWSVTPALGWIFGPYVNHNHYGGLLEMLIPISVCYVLSRPSYSLARIVLWLLVGLSLISVWTSASRGATVAVLVEGLFLGVILIGVRQRVGARGSLPIIVAAMVISAGIFLWMVQSGRTSGRGWDVLHSNQSIDVLMKDRFRGGAISLRMAKDHPWTGIGLGSFEYVFPSYADFATDQYWNHAHDDYAEVIGETGVLGGVLMVIALVMFFRLALRGLGERLRHESGWIQVGALVGCVGLLVHSYVDFNLRIPANAAWFVVCAAIAAQPLLAPGNVRKIHRHANPGRARELLN